ncbi:MAG: hypothetical protein MZV64_49350 [Ignavibacteriales bacterium]|nr:hypothetical protein [Ignavibacteriales bacterium]
MPAGRRLPARPGLALLLQGRQGGPRPARPGLARRAGRRGPADEPALARPPEERRDLAGRRRALEGRGPADPRGRGGGRGQEGPDGAARPSPSTTPISSGRARRSSRPRRPSSAGSSTRQVRALQQRRRRGGQAQGARLVGPLTGPLSG